MNSISDDELREMLEARGERHAIDLRTVAEVARRDAAASPRTVMHRWRLTPVLAGLGSVAAIALALIVVVAPLSLRLAASAEPSELASPAVSPASTANATAPSGEPGPAMAEALTAHGLEDWLANAGAAASGRVVLLDGELITDPTVDCIASRPDCAPTIVRGIQTTIVMEPVGDIGPGPWHDSDGLAGTFALRGTSRTWAGTAPVMEFLGIVRPAKDQLAWQVPEVVALSPADGPAWFLVAGWMVRTSAHPCPSPASEYGCPTDDLLTPERVQPMHTDGSSELPAVALTLRAGTYDEFALDPAPDGAGVVPRAGNFLLQRVSIAPCGPFADCYVGPEHRHWIVRARVDAIEDAARPTPR